MAAEDPANWKVQHAITVPSAIVWICVKNNCWDSSSKHKSLIQSIKRSPQTPTAKILAKRTVPAPLHTHTSDITCSTSLPSSRASSISIKVQPTSAATKLRRVPITKRGTMIGTACYNSRRLDTFALAVATAVTSARKNPSALFFQRESYVTRD